VGLPSLHECPAALRAAMNSSGLGGGRSGVFMLR
jgi:hypothetical protein